MPLGLVADSHGLFVFHHQGPLANTQDRQGSLSDRPLR